MSQASETPAATDPGLNVPLWQDKLGGWIEKHPRLWLRLGNWESSLLKESLQQVTIERPLYVTGLARSGSTILLELLAQHSEVVTHRYRDFPAVPIPWAWNWFVERAGGTERPPEERAHKDGIAVTPESPEALEEPSGRPSSRRPMIPVTARFWTATMSHPEFGASTSTTFASCCCCARADAISPRAITTSPASATC